MNAIKRLLLLALAASIPALAAEPSWDGLNSLKVGAPVEVTTAGGTDTGAFVSSSTETLTIRGSAGERRFVRTDVVRVVSRGRSRRLRHILIGAGAGAAAGLLTDQTLGAYLRNETNPPGARAVIWTVPIAVGGAIGAALPAQRVIYHK